MLVSGKALESAKVQAVDGTIGKVQSFLFDDEQWVVRYLVVRHGFWIFGSDTLISPMSVNEAIQDLDLISTRLTRRQVKEAPGADVAKPVSRRKEEQFLRYYQVPVYWGGAGLWAGAMTPVEAGVVAYAPEPETEPAAGSEEEYHLRSTHEILGYHASADGAEVGKVNDVLMEDATWAIRYLRLSAGKEFGDGTIFVSPHWVTNISWLERKIDLDLPLNRIRELPAMGARGVLVRDEEVQIHEHFGKPRYWV
jgi:uncharacterized protein YrrD